MKYSVEITAHFERDFKKLDRYTQRLIKGWILRYLVDTENPRRQDKGLTANRSGHRRYRVGDYRLLCQIDDGKLVIFALSVGHRREVYES